MYVSPLNRKSFGRGELLRGKHSYGNIWKQSLAKIHSFCQDGDHPPGVDASAGSSVGNSVGSGSMIVGSSVGNGPGEVGSVGCETVGGISIIGKFVGITEVATG